VTKYLSPTGQWLNSYWLAIMWNAWSFDIVKAKNDNVKNKKNDNCVKWWSRVNYLVHNDIFRLYLGYFKMATSQSSTTSCRQALSWNVFRTINCFFNLSDNDESFRHSGCGCALLHGKKTIIFKYWDSDHDISWFAMLTWYKMLSNLGWANTCKY
jgi:hypothetical protein